MRGSVCRSHCPLAIAIDTLRGSGRFFAGLYFISCYKNQLYKDGLPSRSEREVPPTPKMGFGATAFAALRLRRLVGGDGLEPPTFCV
jgi:hypothetical protein